MQNRYRARGATGRLGAVFPQPVASRLLVNGVVAWTAGSTAAAALKPGDTVTLQGTGFGAGPDIDFSKIMIGNSRVLETDLKMYNQMLDLIAEVNYETIFERSSWSKDIISWTDTQVQFKVPAHASKGPLILQVQKRTGAMPSLTKPGQPHNVIDAQTKRITNDLFKHKCDVVSTLSAQTKAIAPIPVTVTNPGFANLAAQGRKIFWSYDYNIGLAHKMRDLDWAKIFSYKTTDPITRQPADPAKLFGAYKTVAGEVPAEAINDVSFDPYPMQNPIPGFLLVTPQKTKGVTKNTGWVGSPTAHREAETAKAHRG